MPSVRVIVLLLIALSPSLLWAKSGNVIAVSILPEKYFVERIAGDHFEVLVLLGEGHNPVTYEPKPRQMSQLSNAKVFFLAGVPFETRWIRVIEKNNPEVKLVSLTNKIELRKFQLTRDKHHHSEDGHAHDFDPHFWLNPLLVKTAAKTIYETLAVINPSDSNLYKENYNNFINELEALDRGIRQQLANVKHRRFAVFHPSWGYFADAYGLQQLAIEAPNRQTGARTLNVTIKALKKYGIKVIFVQKQFSEMDAAMIARETGAKLVQVNPLAENYIENMQKVTRLFVEALQ